MSVRNALLGLLAQRSRHGYELHSAFEAVVGGSPAWEVKPAQIYTTLSRLADGGLVKEEAVEQSGGPEKRIFAITSEGRAALTEWFHTPVDPEHQRDEFWVKLVLSLVTGQADPTRVIQIQRMRLFKDLHALTTRRTTLNPRLELANILMLEKASMHLEADLRWLDLVEARLEDIRRQPLPEPTARPRGRPPKSGRGDGG